MRKAVVTPDGLTYVDMTLEEIAERDAEEAAARLLHLDDYKRAIQAFIDATAREKKYRNGDACATYVNSTNPLWAAEAAAFVAWRDSVWSYAFQELAKVENGEREQPTIDEFLSELPQIEWPE